MIGGFFDSADASATAVVMPALGPPVGRVHVNDSRERRRFEPMVPARARSSNLLRE